MNSSGVSIYRAGEPRLVDRPTLCARRPMVLCSVVSAAGFDVCGMTLSTHAGSPIGPCDPTRYRWTWRRALQDAVKDYGVMDLTDFLGSTMFQDSGFSLDASRQLITFPR